MNGNLPHFLIIGAMKSGTSSLYRNLVNHPQIVSATKKEVHFFDKKYERGLEWYLSHFPLLTDNKDQEHYVTGEASPRYIIHPEAPKRAYDTLPQVKLIALLRNPVDRAYSHYHHMARKGHETRSFKEAVTQEAEQINQQLEQILENYKTIPTSFLTRGIYVDQLERWMRFFPREQFLILKNEDFFADPQSTYNQVTDFLNLPEGDFLEQKQWNVGQYDTLDKDVRKQLMAFFKPHNERLYKLLGSDFGWN